jgi:3-oxoacyl-[acyl-carrier-protein] synthase II
MMAKIVPFRRLGELLGAVSPHAARPAAWIENSALLTHRKWSPATMAALHVARQAINDAGWTPDDLNDAALVVGTSRGNAAGWLGPWPGRRPFRLMAASNTIHSEPASAISIEFGITGPNHVLASGCAAGLDAIGIAMMLVKCGAAPRALAVAVDSAAGPPVIG